MRERPLGRLPGRPRALTVAALVLTALGSAAGGCTAGGSTPARTTPPPERSVSTGPSTSPVRSSTAEQGLPLTGLRYVPAGFTLPPGAVVESRDLVGTQAVVVLSAPSVAAAGAYLRNELSTLGYQQRLTRTAGSVTATAFRRDNSVISISGGAEGSLSVTALTFQGN